MTLAEFSSCALLAYGAPLAMFALTVARDPLRVIVTVAAAFGWLVSFLLASVVWFAVVPLRKHLAFGLVVSVIFQELFRYGIYLLLRKTEAGLKHISEERPAGGRLGLAYVSGLGFGLMSGAFALVNVLADSVGPGTMGLTSGSEFFLVTSSASTLCMILLNTLWSVVMCSGLSFHSFTVGPGTMGLTSGSEFFLVTSSASTLCMILLNTLWSVVMCSGLDNGDALKIAWVAGSHLLLSSLSLLNRWQMYGATLPTSYLVLVVTAIIAFRSAGGTLASLKRSLVRTGPAP